MHFFGRRRASRRTVSNTLTLRQTPGGFTRDGGVPILRTGRTDPLISWVVPRVQPPDHLARSAVEVQTVERFRTVQTVLRDNRRFAAHAAGLEEFTTPERPLPFVGCRERSVNVMLWVKIGSAVAALLIAFFLVYFAIGQVRSYFAAKTKPRPASTPVVTAPPPTPKANSISTKATLHVGQPAARRPRSSTQGRSAARPRRRSP